MKPFRKLAVRVGLICLSTLCVAFATQASDVKGHALLITNHDYKSLEDLPAALADNKAILEILRNANIYDVTRDKPLKNLDAAHLKKAWEKFRSGLTSGGIAFVYFSGHGVEIGNDNYLIPVNISDDPTEAKLRQDGLSLRKMFDEFRARQRELSSKNQTLHGIFIIDACRSPFKENVGTKSLGTNVGVRPIIPPPGMLVMYAAASGQIAHATLHKKEIGKPSVYTRLLKKLMTENSHLSLQEISRRLRWEVFKAVAATSKGKTQPQTPVYLDEIGEAIGINGIMKANHAPERIIVSSDIQISVSGDGGDLLWECELCPELVVVPKGKAVIGTPGNQRTVEISRPFAIGKTEVTRAQFWAYLTTKGTLDCANGHVACDPVSGDKPVTSVSWEDARKYVDWLNERLGRNPKGGGAKGHYRLPTDAEWEYAARAGATGSFVYGEEEEKLCEFGNGADLSLKSLISVNRKCSDHKARGVSQAGSYKPNAFGLQDVHGNVWEWAIDCWSGTIKADGQHDMAIRRCRRVARGGSWRSDVSALKLSSRTAFSQSHRRPTIGFRVVRELRDGEFKSQK